MLDNMQPDDLSELDPITQAVEGPIEGPIDGPTEHDTDPHRQKSRFKVWAIRLLFFGLICVATIIGGLVWILSLATAQPEFYSEILKKDPQQQMARGAEFERQILDMRNSMQLQDDWSLKVSDEQINGWLATTAKQNFPDLFPPAISDPRIVIKDQDVTIAFRCDMKAFKGVVVLRGQIFLTEVLNKVGIHVHSIHSGSLPIPVASVATQISAAAKDADFDLEWEMGGEFPIALIAMPDQLVNLGNGNYLELKAINFSGNEVEIIGKSHDNSEKAVQEKEDK